MRIPAAALGDVVWLVVVTAVIIGIFALIILVILIVMPVWIVVLVRGAARQDVESLATLDPAERWPIDNGTLGFEGGLLPLVGGFCVLEDVDEVLPLRTIFLSASVELRRNLSVSGTGVTRLSETRRGAAKLDPLVKHTVLMIFPELLIIVTVSVKCILE